MRLSDGRPHIVHILGSLGAGGAQRNVYALITHPALSGFRHSVMCILSNQGRFRDIYENAGIPLYFCPVQWPALKWVPSYRLSHWLRKRSVFLFPLRLGQVLRRVGADLVHTNLTAHIAAQAKAVLQFQHLPLVWTVHGLYRSRGEDTPDWPTAFRLVRCSDRAVIVGVSRAALDDVLGDVTLPAGKTRVVYNGIDLTKFSFCGKADTSLRNLWGIPPTATIFGSAGRLIPVKRFDVLIKAAALVIAAHPNVHLVIAGEGPLSEELRHLAYTLGVQEHVHLVGYQPDMERFWANVDVGVIASDSESYSLALLEACASGIPCIGTRVGGIPEVIGDGAGILVEPGSPAALAEAMKHMLDPEVRAAMGQRARAAAERFPLDVTAAQYAELYRELLEKSRGKNHAHACH